MFVLSCCGLYVYLKSTKVVNSFQVLDKGRITEFAEPFVLMKKTDGFLHNLVKQVGADGAADLLEIAKTAYCRKNSMEKSASL